MSLGECKIQVKPVYMDMRLGECKIQVQPVYMDAQHTRDRVIERECWNQSVGAAWICVMNLEFQTLKHPSLSVNQIQIKVLWR